jgi:hypothetical protein
MAPRTRKVKRTPEFLDLCLVSYRRQDTTIEHAAVTTAQRATLDVVGRLVADHGLVPVGMPVGELSAAMRELHAAMAKLADGKVPTGPAAPWVPTYSTWLTVAPPEPDPARWTHPYGAHCPVCNASPDTTHEPDCRLYGAPCLGCGTRGDVHEPDCKLYGEVPAWVECCTCRMSGIGRAVDPVCPIHGAGEAR